MDIQETVTREFTKKFGEEPAHMAHAPGRVNLLGEHVDYNDGLVMPAAINLATWIAFSPSGSDRSTLVAVDLHDESTFDMTGVKSKTADDGEPLSEWARYPAGMAWSLQEKGLSVPGMRAVFSSDVPRGASLSSSASVEMTFGKAWEKLGGWSLPPMELALAGQRAENKYVGMNCGIMDQFASACGEKDRLLLLDCRSLEYRTLPLPEDVAIVIADTSVRRTLVTSAYNQRRASCEEAVRLLQQKMPALKSLRDITVEEFNRLASLLPQETEMRARHVVVEIERTSRAIPMLEKGDVESFGQLMNECHASLRDLFGVSGPELDLMARLAQPIPGCYGARQTGGGFAGCTVNLVKKECTVDFSRILSSQYEKQTGLHPAVYICQASSGASIDY
ncbi:MAG: galactokinase [Leptolinea sp.]|nr:galactokinase [Leptolinea sp.]